MTFEKKQEGIKENVKNLCMKFPAVKNDYRKLVQYYNYYVDGAAKFIPLDSLEKFTQPESITRAFRKLVETGEITISETTQAARKMEEKHFHDYYSPKEGRWIREVV